MVCPLCGKKSEVGMFCSDCYLKKNLKMELPSLIEVPYCKRCMSYLMGGKWSKVSDEDDIAAKAAERLLKTNMPGFEKSDLIKINAEKEMKEYKVTATVIAGDSEIKARSIVRLKKVTCPDCSRMAGGYYEAVLQLRGDIEKKTLEKIVGDLKKHKDTHAFISGIKEVMGGYDVYVGSKKSAEKIVSSFRGKAEVKKSFQQLSFDKQSSKGKHRFYYLIRL